jgi:hypothetical protein
MVEVSSSMWSRPSFLRHPRARRAPAPLLTALLRSVRSPALRERGLQLL